MIANFLCCYLVIQKHNYINQGYALYLRSLNCRVRSLISMPESRTAAMVLGSSSRAVSASFAREIAALFIACIRKGVVWFRSWPVEDAIHGFHNWTQLFMFYMCKVYCHPMLVILNKKFYMVEIWTHSWKLFCDLHLCKYVTTQYV